MDDRLITSSMTMEDEQIEYSLRPRFLNEYIGPITSRNTCAYT